MILVDTSAWIHWLRPDGDQEVAERVERALHDGQACWCAMIRLELWNGAGGSQEKKVLREFQQVLAELKIDRQVWSKADQVASVCRASGVAVPATDILIASCALIHDATVESSDQDFVLIWKAIGNPAGSSSNH